MKFLKFVSDPINVVEKGKWTVKQNINLKWSNTLKVSYILVPRLGGGQTKSLGMRLATTYATISTQRTPQNIPWFWSCWYSLHLEEKNKMLTKDFKPFLVLLVTLLRFSN